MAGAGVSHFQTFIGQKSVKQSAQTLDMIQKTEEKCAKSYCTFVIAQKKKLQFI